MFRTPFRERFYDRTQPIRDAEKQKKKYNQQILYKLIYQSNETIREHFNANKQDLFLPLDINGETLLHLAARQRPQIIPQLLELGANPSAFNSEEQNPLQLLIPLFPHSLTLENLMIGIKLIAAGADANSTNSEGRTLLLAALDAHSNININIIRRLLALGANPKHKDNQGRNALHCVLENRKYFDGEIFKLLAFTDNDSSAIEGYNKAFLRMAQASINTLEEILPTFLKLGGSLTFEDKTQLNFVDQFVREQTLNWVSTRLAERLNRVKDQLVYRSEKKPIITPVRIKNFLSHWIEELSQKNAIPRKQDSPTRDFLEIEAPHLLFTVIFLDKFLNKKSSKIELELHELLLCAFALACGYCSDLDSMSFIAEIGEISYGKFAKDFYVFLAAIIEDLNYKKDNEECLQHLIQILSAQIFSETAPRVHLKQVIKQTYFSTHQIKPIEENERQLTRHAL